MAYIISAFKTGNDNYVNELKYLFRIKSISYAREDKKSAARIQSVLEQNHHEVWIDDKIPPGAPLAQAINVAISDCDYFFVILTNSAQRSPWVMRELNACLFKDINKGTGTIIPLKFDESNIAKLGPLVESIKYVDFTADFESGIIEVLKRIHDSNHFLDDVVLRWL